MSEPSAAVEHCSTAELIERARRLADPGRRRLLGIVGAPGAGKSTLAAQLVQALGPQLAVLVPMDGFHLANEQLIAQGILDVKGAIHTFDDAGYAALLLRLARQGEDEIVYAPRFDRSLEESVGSAIRIDPQTPLVVTEGNYLLAESGRWSDAAGCLDESWYLDIDQALRHDRLIARHQAFGKSPQDARHWALNSDEVNARLIASTASRASLRVRLSDATGPVATAR